MAVRARLTAPQPAQQEWPWHEAKVGSLPVSLMFSGDRRMEAESYLASGYGIRLSFEAQPAGWTRLEELARVWQPNRLKGIQVGANHGTPFLGATQVFDLRPVPRKYLALERTDDANNRFTTSGSILVTCSGSVGRTTLAHTAHENVLISHDLLRVDARTSEWWGWIYAFLHAPQARAMMSAAQYGHIIKHLETSHINALPIPLLKEEHRSQFNISVRRVLDTRSKAYELSVAAEAIYTEVFGELEIESLDEIGFSKSVLSLSKGRRRLDATVNGPSHQKVIEHLSTQGKLQSLVEAGFDIWLPNRFKRVAAIEGIELIGSSNLFEVNPDLNKRIQDGDFGDDHKGRVQAGWMLLSRSGQVYGLNGSITIATAAHENKIGSDHVIRIAPNENLNVRTGYAFVALSHPELGRPRMKSLAYGSSIPEIEVADVQAMQIPRIDRRLENKIADHAEESSRLQAEADILERQLAKDAEAIIDKFLVGHLDMIDH